MSLTLEFIRNNRPIDSGALRHHWSFFGRTLLQLDTGNFYLRRDHHLISMIGYQLRVDIYLVSGRLYAYFPNQDLQTQIEEVDIIHSETAPNDFTGFAPGRRFRLTNGQVWEQVSGVTSSCSPGGIILIKDRTLMQVGNWNWEIGVRQVSGP